MHLSCEQIRTRPGAGASTAGHAPYFRPAGLANAIAATDAVTFRGAPLSLLDEWSSGGGLEPAAVRALLYRLGPTGIFAIRNRLMGILVTHVKRVAPVGR